MQTRGEFLRCLLNQRCKEADLRSKRKVDPVASKGEYVVEREQSTEVVETRELSLLGEDGAFPGKTGAKFEPRDRLVSEADFYPQPSQARGRTVPKLDLGRREPDQPGSNLGRHALVGRRFVGLMRDRWLLPAHGDDETKGDAPGGGRCLRARNFYYLCEAEDLNLHGIAPTGT